MILDDSELVFLAETLSLEKDIIFVKHVVPKKTKHILSLESP